MMVDPVETPTIISVAEGFYVRQAVDNIAWIDMGGFGLVVDALEQPELEQEVFEAIETTLKDRKIRYVLNTHTHHDHTALNRAFVRRFGAEIINQSTCRIPPEGKWLEGSRRRVLMLPMPGCHTSEDCVVWVPADRVLFVGDIFGWGLIPLSRDLNERTAALLKNTYKRLIDFDAAVVVPGHGPICTTAQLARWVEYFDWLHEQICDACAKGMTDTQITRVTPVPQDMMNWWRLEQWKHQDSLGKVISAVRRGWDAQNPGPSQES